jgi:hypothetical protein
MTIDRKCSDEEAHNSVCAGMDMGRRCQIVSKGGQRRAGNS